MIIDITVKFEFKSFYSDAMLMMWRKISNLTTRSKNTLFPVLRSLQQSTYILRLRLSLEFLKFAVIALVLVQQG